MLQVGDAVRSSNDYLLDARGEVLEFGPCPDESCDDPVCAVLVKWTNAHGKTFSLRHKPEGLIEINAMVYIAEQAE